MGVPTSEVGYTSATARRGDHESSYEHVVALGGKKKIILVIIGKPVPVMAFKRYKSRPTTLQQRKRLT